MNQVGIFLRCTGKTDPRQALEAVKSLGIHTIQISKLPDRFYTPEGAKEFATMMHDTGIHAVSVVAVYDGESYKDQDSVRATVGFLPADQVEARLAYTRKCIDFAAALGIKIVTFHVGYIPSNPADPTYQRLVRNVSDVAAYAAQHGVTISLETGQESAAELLRFINKITTARIHVNFDTANLVLYGRDNPPQALRELLSHVTSVHVKDGLPPVNPHLLGKEMPLGEGQAHVKECLRILQDANFHGPLIIECYVWQWRHSDPIEDLRAGVAFVRTTLAELAATAS